MQMHNKVILTKLSLLECICIFYKNVNNFLFQIRIDSTPFFEVITKQFLKNVGCFWHLLLHKLLKASCIYFTALPTGWETLVKINTIFFS